MCKILHRGGLIISPVWLPRDSQADRDKPIGVVRAVRDAEVSLLFRVESRSCPSSGELRFWSEFALDLCF